MDEKAKKIIEESRAYAEKSGFMLNPNSAIVEGIVKGLIRNEADFGKRYCPCRRVHEDATVCPCAFHKKELEEMGHCHCFLFVSKEN